MPNHVLGVAAASASASASKKRKERELGSGAGAPPRAEPIAAPPPQLKPEPDKTGNRLLAGYLAHEFLTCGTILGKPWDPKAQARARAEPSPAKAPRSYADVAYLLRTDGAHVPGIVNPTQLAQWLQM